MTTIQISDKVKRELLNLMANFQKESGKRLTYEDIIRRLIDDFQFSMIDRLDFSKKYYGLLEGKDISSQLRESRNLERY
ncbi:MAG: hypothetical protein GPJ54_21890 [Candidatus Heimdallarchaeota archaeon]|nr:hypothetical protein [Candidatus Heimdallarchaeota archaeon]